MASKKASLLDKYKVDIKEIVSKSVTEEDKKEEKQSVWWKPDPDNKEGSRIRFVPLEGVSDPFKTLFFHYPKNPKIPGLGMAVCLKKNYNAKCPLCEFATDAWNKYTETKDESFKNTFKGFVAQRNPRIIAPIIVRGEEEKGVRWWSFSHTVFQAITGILNDPEYGDILDLFEGLDMKVTVTKSKDKEYPETNIVPTRHNSPLMADEDGKPDEKMMLTILETTPDFETLFERKSAKEMQDILDNHFNVDPTIGDTVENHYDSSSEPQLDDVIKELQDSQE